MNETPEKQSDRIKKMCLHNANSRNNETSEQYRTRLERDRYNKSKHKEQESVQQRIARLKTDKENKTKRRQTESVEQLQMRLLCDRTSKAKKRKIESPSETQCRKVRRKQYEKSKKDSNDTDHLLNALQSDIQKKSHFSYLCVSDLRYLVLVMLLKLSLTEKTMKIVITIACQRSDV